mmetsp:Transcript_51373/g.94964  ORF Transcript_51373/g.94964 Transcript_51373/m.94964 type:complete len:449 (+) Transcript_51373:147-1493(+)
MPLEAFPLSVHVQDYRDVGDHIEFGLAVRHTCGMKWKVWRRYTSFEDVHLNLQKATNNDDRLPTFPPKGWMPHFMQAAQQVFCQQRAAELQRYLDSVLRFNVFATRIDILDFLGLKRPDPPAGLRVIRKDGGVHDLEVRPSKDVEAAPVESYNVSLRRQEGNDWELVRSFTCAIGEGGQQHQVIQLGKLQVGTHEVAVTASNLAGESSFECVTIIVNGGTAPAQQGAGAIAESGTCSGQQPRQTRVRLQCQTRILPHGRLLPDARSGVPRALSSQHTGSSAAELDMHRAATMPSQSGGPATRPPQPYAGRNSLPVHSNPTAARQGRQQPASAAGLASWVASTSKGPTGSIEAPEVTRPQVYHKAPSPHAGSPSRMACAAAPAVAVASTDDDILSCVICLAKPKTHAFVPCGHRCVCESCSLEVLSTSGQEALCPLCRTAVHEAMQIFD